MHFLKFKTAPYFHHMNKFKIYCTAATSYFVSKYMLLYCKAAIASSKVVSYLLRTLFSIYTFIILGFAYISISHLPVQAKQILKHLMISQVLNYPTNKINYSTLLVPLVKHSNFDI